MAAVPESLERTEIAVQPTGGVAAEAVAALIARRYAVETAPMPDFRGCGGSQGTEGTAFQAGRRHIFRRFSRDDIDGAQQRRSPVNPGRRPLEHFDAFDVAKVHRKVERIVPRLRIGDVDSVQQDGDLVVGASADADVGLHAHCAPLAHIHAQGIFKQVVDGLRRGRCDGYAVQERDDAGTAVQGHGNPCRRDRDAVKGFGLP